MERARGSTLDQSDAETAPREVVSQGFPFWSGVAHGESVIQRGTPTVELGHRVYADEGSWASWHWDGEALTAANDRQGFLPLFYSAPSQSELWVSASPIQLINQGVPATLDFDALGVFMRLGFFLANDTPFQGIKVLPPGATLTWRPGRLSIQTAPRAIKPYTGTRDAALDDFITLFRGAMEKRPPTDSRFVLPLSGGRDSRHILLELVKRGWSPTACLTLGANAGGPGTDAAVTAELTHALGIAHRILPRHAGAGVRAEFTKNVLTHMCADEHDWFMPLATRLPGLTRCTYSGVAGTWEPDGGTPLTARISELLDRGDLEPVPDLLLAHFGADEQKLNTLLTARQQEQMPVERVRGRLKEEISRHMGSPNPLGSFWFWNRERREHGLAAHGVLAGVPTVHMPFLDNDIVEHMQSLPTNFLRDASFHTDAVLRAYPEFAKIPFATTQSSMIARSNPLQQASALTDLSRFAVRRNIHRLPTIARFACSQALGTRSMNLRMTAFLVQLESIASGASTSLRDVSPLMCGNAD